ncbi:MAG TPA: DUF502 domain-containing protein [Bdellovibrionota bacterium]|nr:DUF502 domain-containing protein [Bdellovibrionota bacterium]
MRKLIELLKGHFFTGLLVLIPLGVIAWIGAAALSTVWHLRELLPEQWNPEIIFPNPFLGLLINLALTFGATMLLAILVSALGWISKQYLGRQALAGLAHIIERIPVIRSIYSALDQLLKTLAAQGGQQFSRVVYVEYPRKDLWVIAFVTGPARMPGLPGTYLNIYVPTTPNPTSGFHLIVPETEIRESNLRVEEAFKIILSLGIAQNSQPSRLTGQKKPGVPVSDVGTP